MRGLTIVYFLCEYLTWDSIRPWLDRNDRAIRCPRDLACHCKPHLLIKTDNSSSQRQSTHSSELNHSSSVE